MAGSPLALAAGVARCPGGRAVRGRAPAARRGVLPGHRRADRPAPAPALRLVASLAALGRGADIDAAVLAATSFNARGPT